MVVAGSQERLRGRFSPAECVKINPVRIQIHFGSDETMRPVGVDQEGTAHEVDLTLFGGSTQEDDAAAWRAWEIQFPGGGKGMSRWSSPRSPFGNWDAQ